MSIETGERTATEDFVADWQGWKDNRERDLAQPYGWLTIVSRDWLSETPQRYGEVPGRWWQDEDAAYLDPDGAELTYQGEPVTGETRFELVNSGAGVRVVAGDVEIEVARRSGYLLRVHDPKAAPRADFHGIPSYEPAADWVLSATYEPFDEPRPTTVGAVVEGLSHVYVAPGVVRFEHDGAQHTLTAFNGKQPGTFSILFTDETSGKTTYGANRSIAFDAPDAQGRVRLDFNRATNLPCAFTDLATCPLPPAGNHLPFEVTAGELLPYERHN